MRIFLTVSILLLTLSGSLAGESLTLQRAIDRAFESNPQLEVVRQRVLEADGRRIDIRKWENPSLKFWVGEAPVGGRVSQGQVQLRVMQEIPFPGKKKLDRQIGSVGVERWNYNLLSARVLLLREVKIAFFEVLATERRFVIAGEVLELTQSSSAAVTKRIDAGRGVVQELLRAEIDSERATAEMENSGQLRKVARQRLAVLLGDKKSASAAIEGSLESYQNLSLAQQVNPQMDADELSLHPQLAAARAAIKEADLSLKRERLERMPNLTAGLQGGRDGSSQEDIFGFSFSVPLPLINRRQGTIKQAGANLEIAKRQLDAARLALTTQLRSVYQRHHAALKQVEIYRDRILPKANEAVKLTRKGFAEGRFTLTDLLDTQRTTASVRLVFQDKLLELLNAQAEIEALLDQSGTPEKRKEMKIETEKVKPKQR